MHQTEKESRVRRLTAQLETSALSWAISVIFHCLIVAILMFITFRKFSSGGTSNSDTFEVELGIQTNQQSLTPPIQQTSAKSETNTVKTVTTPISQEEFVVETVDESAVEIQVQNIEQAISPGKSSVFSESLAGSDTAGTAGFFGLTAGGTKFVYVIDRSGSMSGNRLLTAVDELCRSVNSLSEKMSFYIIFYESGYTAMNSKDLVSATRSNKAKHLRWARNLPATGGTEPSQAMLLALSLDPDAIWLLSDGQFDQDVASIVKKANGKGVQIHTLAFGSNSGEAQLKIIAAQNGGKYRFIPVGANF